MNSGPAVKVCAIFILVLLCSPCLTSAVPDEVDARGVARLKGLLNTDEGATVLDGRIDLEVDIGVVTFGAAYRAYQLGRGNYNPAGIKATHEIKHRYVEGRVGKLYFRGGHFFSTFGRGLALRSFEDVDLEYDTALDGFVGEYETGRLLMTVLGGQVTERISDIQSVEHRVRGARARARFGDLLALGLSGLDRDSNRQDEQVVLPDRLAKFNDHVFGTDVEMWMGPISVTGEYAYRQGGHYTTLEQGDVGGHGVYLSGNLGISRLVVLGEYKDYDKFEHALINPPVCVKEHPWTLMNRVTHQVDHDDEKGFLSEGVLSVSQDVQVTAGASEARTQRGGLKHWEMFAQADQTPVRWGIRSVAGSWSREYASGKFTEFVSGAMDMEFTLVPGRVAETGFEFQVTEEPSGRSHEDYLGSVTLYAMPNLTVTGYAETTTLRGLRRDVWVFGEVRVGLADDVEVSLGGGTERGGKKCSGGICYTEPEFAGVRLRLLSYF